MESVELERTPFAPSVQNGKTAHSGDTPVEQFVQQELSRHAHHQRRLLRLSKSAKEFGPLPIVLGVTGHRDLRPQDIDHLEEILRNEFVRFQSDYPSTPLVLLSALADGADRLAAQIALTAGLRLAVVLPMPAEEYEEDFSVESCEEFRALIAQAEYLTELPILAGVTREDIRAHSYNREMQYASAGAYIASHSTLLIALWDGIELQKIGGTSQVVKFRLEGIPEPFAVPRSELDSPDCGPVYHIVSPRISNTHTVSRPFGTHRLFPAGFGSQKEAAQASDDICARMETFNEDAIAHADELKDRFRQSKEYVFSGHARKALHEKLTATLEEDLDFYAIADVLSQRFQKRTKTTLTLLLTFVFFAAAFFELYSGPFPEPIMLGLYLCMFLTGYLSHRWAAKNNLQTKYLDYRALAEGLRVQFFWKLAGLNDSVADYYMRKQRSELDWIRNAIRTSTIEVAHSKEQPLGIDSDRQHLKLVYKHWVEDQAKYFAKAAHRDHEELHKHEKTVSAVFVAALLAAVIQMLFVHSPSHYLILSIALLPVIGALIHSWLQKNAFVEHKRQYDRMSVFYHRAMRHLHTLLEEDRLEDARRFLGELGKEALAENG
ncbi:MAG TPA: hypothetical protein VGM92_11840, partial [Candidatus Kapabacteria bacterium]